MRLLSFSMLLLLHASGACLAQAAPALYRCEGPDGRVTYADERCPEGLRQTRKVDDSPPVQVQNAKEAAARDGAAADADDKTAGKSGPAPRPAPMSGAGTLQAARVVGGNASPEQELQRLDEDHARQRRECTALARRIDYARADLLAASESQRASSELALRRLQEQRRLACPRG
jgi:hypothetical protein